MGFWGKVWGGVKKVGETAGEVEIVHRDIDILKARIELIARSGVLTQSDVLAVLAKIEDIRSGVIAVTK